MGKQMFIAIYALGEIATTLWLLWRDVPNFNWWNWLIIVPVDLFMGAIWPIYWLILRPIFGG